MSINLNDHDLNNNVLNNGRFKVLKARVHDYCWDVHDSSENKKYFC